MRRDPSISYKHAITSSHDEEIRPGKIRNFLVIQHRLMECTYLMRKGSIDQSRHHHVPDTIGTKSTHKSANPNPSASPRSNHSPRDSESIDNVTLFRQLSILKRGGYWKHLQREEEYREGTTPQQSWRNYNGGNDEDKENAPHIDEDDNDDDDDDEEEIDDGYLVECALFNTDQVGVGGPRGFYVHAVTEDGWMCSDDQLRDDVDVKDDDQQDECEEEARRRRQNVERQHLMLSPSSSTLLLRLPKKVASLGRKGMLILGINLMERRHNGAIEPCNHYSNSNHGTIVRPSSESSEDLYGRISI